MVRLPSIALLLALACLLLGQEGGQRVLVLNSYHPAYGWTDEQVRGILERLDSAGIAAPQVAIEYLDAKRYPELGHGEDVARLLEAKYRTRSLRCVIVTDNAALTYALSHRAQLFPDTPIVFCGLNGWTPQMLAGVSGVTGIAELVDVAGTIRLARRLHPRATRLAVIYDQTITGRLLHDDFQAAWHELGAPLELVELTDLTFDELHDRLHQLDRQTIVLMLSHASDRMRQVVEQSEEAGLISAATNAPVYALHEARLGHGIVGGILLSGHDHGARAGALAVAILGGADPATLPVERVLTTRPMFDAVQLERHSIDQHNLPAGSTVVNIPHSLWRDYRSQVIAAGLTALVLVGIISALIASMLARRRTLARLAASERFLDETQQASGTGSYAYDLVGDTWHPTPTLVQLLGLSPDHPRTAAGWLALVHPDDRAAMQAYFTEEVVGRRQPFDRSYRLAASDADGPRWVHGLGRLQCAVDGTPQRLIGTIQDITARMRAELALREAAAQWQSTFDAVHDAIWLLDTHHRILRSNRAANALAGRDGTCERLRCWELAHDGQGPIPDCPVERARRSLQRETGEVRIGERLYEVTADPILDGQGAFAGCVHLVSDITDIRHLEEQQRHVQKMNAIGQLAGGVAHDFNNQLAGIMGYAELLTQRLDDPRLRGYAASILTAAQRSADLTGKLLAFARKGQYRRVTVDVHALLDEALAILQRSIDRRIVIARDLAATPATVVGDPSQLANAFLNLGLNARDAMAGSGGTLSVSTALHLHPGDAELAPGRYIRIQVADTGCGMDAQVRAHLFEPFFTTKPPGQGTGMGLAAVYGTVHNHGGGIRVDSTLGRGTTFTLFLPLGAEAGSTSGAGMARVPRRRGLRILVADDEDLVRGLLVALLEADGHTVLPVADGHQAVETFRAQHAQLDLVILDMMMPVMDGRDAARALRGIDATVPVLLSTGHSLEGGAQEILDDGVGGYLHKPFQRTELQRAIDTLISPGGGPAPG